MSKIECLEPSGKLERALAERLADLHAQMPLLVTIAKSLFPEFPDSFGVLSSEELSDLDPLKPLLSRLPYLKVPQI
jgi:hypothetical protein